MTAPRPQVSIITLGVSNLPRAISFYEAMGLERAGHESPGIAFYDLGGTALALYGWDRLAEDCELPPQSVGFRGVSLAWCLPDRSAVDAAIDRALRNGASLVKPASAVVWGGYSGYIADPDDHLWEIAHNPVWPLRANGALDLPAPLPT